MRRGVMYVCRWVSRNEPVAVKFLHSFQLQGTQAQQEFLHECEIMIRLRFQYLVPLLGVSLDVVPKDKQGKPIRLTNQAGEETKLESCPALVMEYYDRGTLYDCLH